MPQKPAKNLAQQIAKQIAREPLEILNDAREQTIGSDAPGRSEERGKEADNQKKIIEHQNDLQDQMKSARRMEALNRELEDIKKRDLFKDLQRRISEGEEVPLEDYPELSIEEKQVLNAQMEAVKVQMENAKSENGKSFVEPASKKGRQLFNFGKKTAMKREQTHVEKPVPPSG